MASFVRVLKDALKQGFVHPHETENWLARIEAAASDPSEHRTIRALSDCATVYWDSGGRVRAPPIIVTRGVHVATNERARGDRIFETIASHPGLTTIYPRQAFELRCFSRGGARLRVFKVERARRADVPFRASAFSL
jgi:hypothetical protein